MGRTFFILNRDPHAAGHSDLVFGPFRTDRDARLLTRQGEGVTMGGRALDLLIVLAEAKGQIIEKHALLDRVWPGLAVEENNLQVQISALRKTLGEGMIITVPGRGYRLNTAHAQLPDIRRSDGKPSIAVLAFANVGGDPEQEFFADGVADDIRTGLSRNRSLFVIARNSGFFYRDHSSDPKLVARELRVQYIVDGSVRRSGNRVRITTQVVDMRLSSHIWADRYDRDMGDIFAIQDEIARSVVRAIDPAISHTERQRAIAKSTENLNAWEAWHQALWHWAKGGDLSAPRGFLERAISLDPQFTSAHALLAHIYLSETTIGTGRPMSESIRLAETSARTAVYLDPENSLAHAMLAWVFDHKAEVSAALDAAEVAIELNPNDHKVISARGIR
jgi:TolB-like protein